jgi:hypothetical protein
LLPRYNQAFRSLPSEAFLKDFPLIGKRSIVP